MACVDSLQITLEMLKPVLSSDVGKRFPSNLESFDKIIAENKHKIISSRTSRHIVSDDEDDDDDDDDDDMDLCEEDKDDISEQNDSLSISPPDRAISDVGDSSGATCSLIVSFVHSSPSFTVRSLYDTKVLILF